MKKIFGFILLYLIILILLFYLQLTYALAIIFFFFLIFLIFAFIAFKETFTTVIDILNYINEKEGYIVPDKFEHIFKDSKDRSKNKIKIIEDYTNNNKGDYLDPLSGFKKIRKMQEGLVKKEK